MTLTFKALSKSGKAAIYSGLRTVIRVSTSVFQGGTPPPTFEVSGAEFADPRVPRQRETPEERKARLSALPKLTLAQKIERRELALAKLKAKAAAQQPAAV